MSARLRQLRLGHWMKARAEEDMSKEALQNPKFMAPIRWRNELGNYLSWQAIEIYGGVSVEIAYRAINCELHMHDSH